MKAFVESNPGLRSRFNKFFEFPDYTVDELQEIFKLQCRKYQYKLTDEAAEAVRQEIIRLEASKGENFANAREVRNLFEKIITNQAARVADLEDVDEETLTTITIEDLVDEEDANDMARKASEEADKAEADEDKTDEADGDTSDETGAAAGEMSLEEILDEIHKAAQETLEKNQGEGSEQAE